MSQIVVDKNLCKRDGACIAVCPPRTLVLGKDGFPEEVLESRCILCGHCVAVCSCDALTHSGLPEEDFLPVSKEVPTPEVIDGLLMSLRSVREFKNRPVSKDALEALLDVARRAPTASNSQKLHWIVVEAQAKVRALSEETINWLRTSEIDPAKLQQWDNGYDFILREAPTIIVACTPADYAWGKQDCAIALTLGYAVHGGLMLGERKHSYSRIPPRKPLSVQWA